MFPSSLSSVILTSFFCALSHFHGPSCYITSPSPPLPSPLPSVVQAICDFAYSSFEVALDRKMPLYMRYSSVSTTAYYPSMHLSWNVQRSCLAQCSACMRFWSHDFDSAPCSTKNTMFTWLIAVCSVQLGQKLQNHLIVLYLGWSLKQD